MFENPNPGFEPDGFVERAKEVFDDGALITPELDISLFLSPLINNNCLLPS